MHQQLSLNKGRGQSLTHPKSEQQEIVERLQALERQVASLQSEKAKHSQASREMTEKREQLEKEVDNLRAVNQKMAASLASLCKTLGDESGCSNEGAEMDAEAFERVLSTLQTRLSELEKMEAENAAMRAEIEALQAESRPRGLQCISWFRPKASPA